MTQILKDIELDKLIEFSGDTPFNDYTGTELFEDLVRDIDENGVLTPISVRETQNGSYEILAGKHRVAAQKYLHRETIPAYVHPIEMDDVDAMYIHINTNFKYGRKEISLVEKLKAIVSYESTLEKRQGQRSERYKEGERIDRYQHLADVFKLGSRKTALNYLRIGKELPLDILEKIDKFLPLSVALELIKVEESLQQEIFQYLREGNVLDLRDFKIISEARKKNLKEPNPVSIEKMRNPAIDRAMISVEDMFKNESEQGSYTGGFSVAEDFEFSGVAQEHAPMIEERIKGPEKKIEKNNFFNIIKNTKKKSFVNPKLDRERLPERFLQLPAEDKAELIISLIKNWDRESA